MHNHGPTRARELGLDDAALAEQPPAAHRLVGALVAGQPPRRRSPGERAAGVGAPRRPRRAAGLPRRPDLPPVPDRQLVRRAPQRDRHRRPPDRPRAHRARRAGAHEHRPGRAACRWRCTGDACEQPSPSLAIGMPKAQTGASLFESGDGVWLHLMGEPTKSPLFRDAMAEVRPEGQPRRSERALRDVRRLGRSTAPAPERRVARDLLGQRRARAARASLRARSSPTSRPGRTTTSSRSTIPSSAGSRWPGRPSPSTRRRACVASHLSSVSTPTRCCNEWKPRAPERSAPTTGADAPLAARGREGGRPGRVPRRSARAHAPRRPRRRRDEARAA